MPKADDMIQEGILRISDSFLSLFPSFFESTGKSSILLWMSMINGDSELNVIKIHFSLIFQFLPASKKSSRKFYEKSVAINEYLWNIFAFLKRWTLKNYFFFFKWIELIHDATDFHKTLAIELSMLSITECWTFDRFYEHAIVHEWKR